MLYDPNWKKPDVHSLESLIEWLEGKDPKEKYYYECTGSCLLAQYYAAKFKPEKISVGPYDITFKKDGKWHENIAIPEYFNDIAIVRYTMKWGRAGRDKTFGHALERAKHCLELRDEQLVGA